ncbi:hypothetical protein LTS18_003083, partial [Coniosporium uncinatum]
MTRMNNDRAARPRFKKRSGASYRPDYSLHTHDSSRTQDDHRASNSGTLHGGDHWQPPLPREPAPPPPSREPPKGPRDGGAMHQFGNSFIPINGSTADEFSFRSNAQAPRFPAQHQNGYNGTSHQQTRRRYGQANGHRPMRNRFTASDRSIINAKRERTPERLDGMNEGQARFRPIDELSESEAEMDLEP